MRTKWPFLVSETQYLVHGKVLVRQGRGGCTGGKKGHFAQKRAKGAITPLKRGGYRGLFPYKSRENPLINCAIKNGQLREYEEIPTKGRFVRESIERPFVKEDSLYIQCTETRFSIRNFVACHISERKTVSY